MLDLPKVPQLSFPGSSDTVSLRRKLPVSARTRTATTGKVSAMVATMQGQGAPKQYLPLGHAPVKPEILVPSVAASRPYPTLLRLRDEQWSKQSILKGQQQGKTGGAAWGLQSAVHDADFRMLSPEEISCISSRKEKSRSVSPRVTNLIDFNECNVLDKGGSARTVATCEPLEGGSARMGGMCELLDEHTRVHDFRGIARLHNETPSDSDESDSEDDISSDEGAAPATPEFGSGAEQGDAHGAQVLCIALKATQPPAEGVSTAALLQEVALSDARCGLALGAATGAFGAAAGTIIGFVAGLAPALVTFGLSIPVGSGIGAAAGLCTGGIAGASYGRAGDVPLSLVYECHMKPESHSVPVIHSSFILGICSPIAKGADKQELDLGDVKKRVRVASALCGACVLGSVGGTTGTTLGGLIGMVCGLPPAFFTFGLSIPIAAAVGSSMGFCIGTAAGGSAGLACGSLAARAFFSNEA